MVCLFVLFFTFLFYKFIWSVYLMDYYLAMQKNEVLIPTIV